MSTRRRHQKTIVTNPPTALTETLSHAAELRSREAFLDGVVRDFDAMRIDAVAWTDELEEREAWTTTLGDGLS